jgi:RNase P subunit RPR2
MVKDNKKIEKINFLIDFAISEKKENNPYIYDYIKIAFRLAKKIKYPLSKEIHRKVCKKCFTLRDLENTKIRTERRKVNGEYRKYIKLHCLSCSYIKKIRV